MCIKVGGLRCGAETVEFVRNRCGLNMGIRVSSREKFYKK